MDGQNIVVEVEGRDFSADTDNINIKIYPDDMGVNDKALYMMIESVLSNLPYKIKHAV